MNHEQSKGINDEDSMCDSGGEMRKREGALLHLPDKPQKSWEDFWSYLEKCRLEGELGAFFQLIPTISTFDDREALIKKLEAHRFKLLNESGNLFWFETHIKDKYTGELRTIPYHMFYDEKDGVHLFLTQATKTEEMPDTILSFIESTRDISNLWIAPSLMHNIKEDLESLFSDDFQLSYFTAIRNASTKKSADTRPEFDRTIQYTGADAKDTLAEFEYKYGVYPKIMEVGIGAQSRFRIDNKGILTLREGRLSPVLSALKAIIRNALPVAKAVLTSRYERKRIGPVERWFQHPFQISMPNGLVQDIDPDFLGAIANDDWRFIPVLPYVENQTPYLSSRIIDGTRSSSFDVEISRNRAYVYPIDRMDIGSALRFCQFVNLNVDVEAVVGIA